MADIKEAVYNKPHMAFYAFYAAFYMTKATSVAT